MDNKVLTLDLPTEIIKKIDESPISVTKRGHKSRMFRFLLIKGLEQYINQYRINIPLVPGLRLQRI